MDTKNTTDETLVVFLESKIYVKKSPPFGGDGCQCLMVRFLDVTGRSLNA